MATEVQCKSQLPGYNFTRDINEDTYVSWSRNYDDRAQDRQLYNVSMQGSVNEYLVYDKETLKRTMLEQEAIFKKQVHELHRLYMIQKNMMDERKQYGSFRLPVHPDARQANSFPVPNETSNRMWERTCFPVGSTNYGNASVGYPKTDHVRLLNFPCRSSIHPTWLPIENESAMKMNGHPDSESKVYPREVVDLHLPADVYIQSERSEISEKGFSSKSLSHVSTSFKLDDIDLNHDVRLSLGVLGDPSSKVGNLKKDTLKISSASSHCFADLKSHVKDRRALASMENYRPRYNSKGIQEHQFPLHTQRNVTNISKDGFIGRCKKEGFIPIVSNEEHIENESHDCSIFKSIEGQTWLPKKLDHDMDILGKSPATYSNDLQLKMSIAPGSFSVSPMLGSMDTTSTQSASSTKARNGTLHAPFALQELPRFNLSDKLHSSVYEKYSRVCKHPYSNGYLRANLFESTCVSEKHHPPTISRAHIHNDDDDDGDTTSQFHKCFKHSQCTYAKSARGLNMNQNFPACDQVNLSSKLELFNSISCLRNMPVSGDSAELKGLIPQCQAIQRNALLSHPILQQGQNPVIEKVSFRGHINLNFAATDAEYSIKPSSSPRGKANIFSEIDLAAPILSPMEESMFSFSEANLIREAAENIISISSGNARTSSPVEWDLLHWFVEIVLNLDSDGQKDMNASGSEDSQATKNGQLDHFESRTLRLQEVNVDENIHRENEAKNQMGDGASARSLLLSKCRRGKARKRRQPRDFQKDILPGLAYLSRHEITTDLHNIGGLLKSYGRRNMDRNKEQCRGKFARQRRSLAVTISEAHASLQVPQLITSDVGWGRTTRRCRTQRCPPVNYTANLKV